MRARFHNVGLLLHATLLLLCIGILSLFFRTESWAIGTTLAPGNYEFTLDHAGRSRYYLVHVPPQIRNGRALPVLLAFHGGGGDPAGMKENYGIDALADREGFLAVYPAGTGFFRKRLLTWNAESCCGYAMEHAVDDAGFVLQALRDLAVRLPVDRTRVYATGHSNGAMMAWHLASALPERIAAIVPVAGCIDAPISRPARAMPILHIHSVDDPRAIYGGGEGPAFPLSGVRSMHGHVAATLAAWARFNGCASDSSVIETRGPVSPGRRKPTQSAELLRFASPGGAAPVLHWRIHGAGHAWPGQKPMLSERVMGPSTRILNASEEAWKFCRQYSRPDAPPLR